MGLACFSLGYQGGCFHAPQAATPVWLCSYRYCPPGKKTEKTTLLAGSPVSECTRRERQERNQSSVEERERQRNREGTGEPDPNLAPPMGSEAAQRQVITSKLGPCSPRLVGGGKGRGSPGSYTDVLGGSNCGFCHIFPILPGQDASQSQSTHPLLGNLGLKCSPQTLRCWDRGGA